ncbi:hypothetical protein MMC15_002828 [Xylographa vitiligo]|nr:hypothetical protein [Xylographa vitiligo]
MPTTNEVPSFSWHKCAIRYPLLSLVFFLENFKISAHEKSRIATTVDELATQGKVTTEPSQQNNWIRVFILRRITRAIFVDALNNGTKNWDVTLSKITSIILTSSFSARAGDILTDRLDD